MSWREVLSWNDNEKPASPAIMLADRRAGRTAVVRDFADAASDHVRPGDVVRAEREARNRRLKEENAKMAAAAEQRVLMLRPMPRGEVLSWIVCVLVATWAFKSATLEMRVDSLEARMVELFARGHGKGGQNRNKRETKVRCRHQPSGAEGIAEDERSQGQNRRLAFERCVQSEQFKKWLRVECARRGGTEADIEDIVNQLMSPGNIKVESHDDQGRWVPGLTEPGEE